MSIREAPLWTWWTTQARCPHAHSDSNKTSRRFKNRAKVYPLDHAMKQKSFAGSLVLRATGTLLSASRIINKVDRNKGRETDDVRYFIIA
jgi:hypothetical protein